MTVQIAALDSFRRASSLGDEYIQRVNVQYSSTRDK